MVRSRHFVTLYASLALLSGAPRPGRAEFHLVCAVDPPDRLARATVLLDRVNAITGTNGKTTTIEAPTPVDGVDLDLGWNDYAQIRMSVPANTTGPVRLSYGTTVHPGFSADRAIVVPSRAVLRDGRPHTYRLDLGLEVHWRDGLRQFRVEAHAGSRIEYVEIGDLPGDALHVNEDLNIFVGDDQHKAETRADLKQMESKHFVYRWSPMSYVSDKGFDPAVMPRRALRMSEECYQVFCKLAGYREPFEQVEAAKRDSKRYKVNITSWYGGTWMGGQNGWTYYNIPGWGLRDEGWGNPVPHEFGHAVQGMQPGFLNGAFWESHANYLRELRNRHYRAVLPGYHSSLERGPLSQSCVVQDHQRFIYADFRIYLALDEIAAEAGLGQRPAARLWTDGPKEMTAWDKLASLLPKGRSVKDVACLGLMRFALLDFADGDAYRAALKGSAKDAAAYDHAVGSTLELCQDKPGWWRVPIGRAPMRYGFMMHDLSPGRHGPVQVEVRGMDTRGKGEDWRWSLVASGPKTKPRYSPVWAAGKHTFSVRSGETRLLLVVVATPDVLNASPAGFQDRFPLDRHPAFLRYPYEVRLVGAAPARPTYAWPRSAGHRHPNGGGFVASTATVDASAYVAPSARVLDRARVRGNARILNCSVVSDDAVVQDRAVAADWAWIGDRSVLRDAARAQGHCVLNNVEMSGIAVARGNATPWDCKVGGHAILDYDYSMAFTVNDGVQFNHVPWGGWFGPYWAETLRKPRGLIASYRMEQPDGEVCWDEFGGLQAYLRGRPAIRPAPGRHGRALVLDGKTQWMALDRAVCDAASLTFSVWCKPSGTAVDQPLVFLGRTGGAQLRLTARDASGRVACVARTASGAMCVLRSAAPTPAAWSHIAVTVGNGSMRLFVNGRAAGSAPCTLAPGDMLGPEDGQAAQANYLGRDIAGRLFAGSIADVRFYNCELTDAEIAAEMRRCGDLRAATLPNDTRFDGATALETGTRNGLVRTLAAHVDPEVDAPAGVTMPVFDSRDERDAALHGAGFGVRDGSVIARLDGVGDWDTGVRIVPGEWAHVALAFDGKQAGLFVNGKLAASRKYKADPTRLSPKNYRLGYAQTSEDAATRTYFRGSLRDTRVYDRCLPASELPRTRMDAR